MQTPGATTGLIGVFQGQEEETSTHADPVNIICGAIVSRPAIGVGKVCAAPSGTNKLYSSNR